MNVRKMKERIRDDEQTLLHEFTRRHSALGAELDSLQERCPHPNPERMEMSFGIWMWCQDCDYKGVAS